MSKPLSNTYRAPRPRPLHVRVELIPLPGETLAEPLLDGDFVTVVESSRTPSHPWLDLFLQVLEGSEPRGTWVDAKSTPFIRFLPASK